MTGNELAERVLAMCHKRDWDMSWPCRGCYLHLEASELTESLRGKGGTPLAEAGDVLLVLMSITQHAGISWDMVMEQTARTVADLDGLVERYPGEHYLPGSQ